MSYTAFVFSGFLPLFLSEVDVSVPSFLHVCLIASIFFCLYVSLDDNLRLLFIVAAFLFFFRYASSSCSLRLMFTSALSLFLLA